MNDAANAEVVENAMRNFYARIKKHAELIDRTASLPLDAAIVDEEPPELRKAHIADRRKRALLKAIDVLGTRDKALHWLQSPNRALGGGKPSALVATDAGLKQVEIVLDRIEYGVYS